jgi:hypothetical protein
VTAVLAVAPAFVWRDNLLHFTLDVLPSKECFFQLSPDQRSTWLGSPFQEVQPVTKDSERLVPKDTIYFPVRLMAGEYTGDKHHGLVSVSPICPGPPPFFSISQHTEEGDSVALKVAEGDSEIGLPELREMALNYLLDERNLWGVSFMGVFLDIHFLWKCGTLNGQPYSEELCMEQRKFRFGWI